MSVRPPRLTGVGLSHPHVCACVCTRVWACAYACVHACVWACVCAHTCACAYPRVYARRRVRMGACAYMRGYGTVRGGGMRLSDVGSCLVIVAWCNCCMCNYMGMGVVAWALWFDGFCGGYGGFDTPRNASGCNGFSGGLRYRLAFQYWTAYSDSHQPRNTKKGTPR